jgi:hypothetical protein
MSGAPFKQPSESATSKPAPSLAVVPIIDKTTASRLPESDFKAESRVEPDSTGAFRSEAQLARAAATQARLHSLRKVGGVVLICAVVGAGSWLGWRALKGPKTASPPSASSMGTAVFNSSPTGASIVIDGVAQGVTPLKLALAAGAHTVTITSNGVSRTLPLTVDGGAVLSQYVELAVEPQSAKGRLEIGSDPPGAEVRIDGALRGVAPLVVADLPVGQHKVTVSNGDTTVNRTVSVTGGSTATVVVSTAGAPAAAAGWLTFDAPFEMEVREGARLIGTTRTDRLMLPVGAHDLVVTNADLEFTAKRTVHIVAGKTDNVSISPPSGKLSVNAVPWADVSIDGKSVGTTPLGNVSVPIGSHEILWHHPQLGERRQTVSIKAQSPTRLGVDFTK